VLYVEVTFGELDSHQQEESHTCFAWHDSLAFARDVSGRIEF
jgi:hypothetical protein